MKLFIDSIILLVSVIICSDTRRINKDFDISLLTANSQYVIKSTIDLHGNTLIVPERCVLVFKKNGKLINGTLIGNETKIRSLKDQCLGISIKGSWITPKICDSYFDSEYLTDNQILDNITSLQSDSIFNRITLKKSNYSIGLSKNHINALSLSSNTELRFNSIIELEGNDLLMYSIINVNRKDNVTIKGGMVLGDVNKHNYVEGSTSEWGFGVYVYKSKNVRIEGLSASKCSGDGIYIGGGKGSSLDDSSEASKNIYIKKTICDDNRRQGMSITYADGVFLEDCVFSNTGKTEFTSPGCGLDIEPNPGQSVRNVTVKRCQFLHNERIMDISVGGYRTEEQKCNVEKVLFDECYISGKISIRTGSVTLENSSMGTLELVLAKMPKDKVYIEKCKIVGGRGVTLSTSELSKEFHPAYTFNSCVISTEHEEMGALFNIVKNTGNGFADFFVNKCVLILPDGVQYFSLFPSKTNMSFYFRNSDIHSKGRLIDLNTNYYSNCVIVDRFL